MPNENYGENWNPSADDLFMETPDGVVPKFGKDELAKNFGLDEDEYGMYFPDFQDYQVTAAEGLYDVAEAENLAKADLLQSTYESRTGRLEDKGEENIASLAQNIGQAYSQAATGYADTVAQTVGQQVSFTSGASGRARAEVGMRAQENMQAQASKSNLAFTSTERDLTQAEEELEANKIYDDSANARALTTAGIKKDLKVETAKDVYMRSVYDTLLDLSDLDAWADPEQEEYGMGHAVDDFKEAVVDTWIGKAWEKVFG